MACFTQGKNRKVFASCTLVGLLYRLDISIPESSQFWNLEKEEIAPGKAYFSRHSSAKQSLYPWHRRLGHLGYDNVKKTASIVNGIDFSTSSHDQEDFCHPCQLGQQKARNIYSQPKRTLNRFELIHIGLGGPFEQNCRGQRYYLVNVDDSTRMTWTFPMKNKAEAWYYLSNWMNWVINQYSDSNIKTIRCDNGGEFISDVGRQYCLQHGITLAPTSPYTPSKNGTSY